MNTFRLFWKVLKINGFYLRNYEVTNETKHTFCNILRFTHDIVKTYYFINLVNQFWQLCDVEDTLSRLAFNEKRQVTNVGKY